MLKKFFLLLSLFAALRSAGQVVTECPPNIGFERGDFDGWESATGNVIGRRFADPTRSVGSVVLSPSRFGRQLIVPSGAGEDEFGHFSLDAPNGSNYVVKLGTSASGAEAEQISYTLKVPSNVSSYSIIFNYAVVFEDRGHPHEQQPKFTAKVIDVTSNTTTTCGSFEFVALGGLPGFFVSDIKAQQNADVLYKPWSPVFVNLSDYIGHTIRLEFTTNDCSEGGHFGYAYIDFNENCSIPITGNITCPEVDSITLRVIPGFFEYLWYNLDTKQELGNSDTLLLSPVPPPGTRIALTVIPYPGLGCTQTIFTSISGISLSVHDPPPDCTSVNLKAISVTVGNSSDLSYSYWMDQAATIPIPDPSRVTRSGVYFIRGESSSGCVDIKPVNVQISLPPAIVVTNPEPVAYPQTVDITKTFPPQAGVTYSYWLDEDATKPLRTPASVRSDGTFYIKGVSAGGCVSIEPVAVDVIFSDVVIPNTFTPNGDGINDVLTVLMDSKFEVRMFRIYNRWGDVVFSTPEIENYWDGLREGSRVPAGVYYWVLEGKENSGNYTRSGSVTVIR